MLKTRGLLITLEGIDGCGKTTQAAILQHNLEENGIQFVSIREPGGTAVGEDIRQVLLHNHDSLSLHAELLLYMAARSELTEQVIIPSLQAGKVVVCDRFIDSTVAYQGYGGGADLKLIRLLNQTATGGVSPELTILLDLPVEEAAGRRGERADRMEKNDYNYHRRVRRGYLEIARREPQRVVVVDAAADQVLLGYSIWQMVRDLIKKGVAMRNEYDI